MRASERPGSYLRIKGGWSDPKHLSARGEKLYVCDGKMAYAIDPADGSYTRLKGSWTEPKSLTPLGDKLYVFDGCVIYALAPAGGYTKLKGTWNAFQGLAALGDKLCVCEGGTIYVVDPASGDSTKLKGSWDQPQAMSAHGGKVYAALEFLRTPHWLVVLPVDGIPEGLGGAIEGTAPGRSVRGLRPPAGRLSPTAASPLGWASRR